MTCWIKVAGTDRTPPIATARSHLTTWGIDCLPMDGIFGETPDRPCVSVRRFRCGFPLPLLEPSRLLRRVKCWRWPAFFPEQISSAHQFSAGGLYTRPGRQCEGFSYRPNGFSRSSRRLERFESPFELTRTPMRYLAECDSLSHLSRSLDRAECASDASFAECLGCKGVTDSASSTGDLQNY